MPIPTHIQRMGDLRVVIYDNGRKSLMLPTNGNVFIAAANPYPEIPPAIRVNTATLTNPFGAYQAVWAVTVDETLVVGVNDGTVHYFDGTNFVLAYTTTTSSVTNLIGVVDEIANHLIYIGDGTTATLVSDDNGQTFEPISEPPYGFDSGVFGTHVIGNSFTVQMYRPNSAGLTGHEWWHGSTTDGVNFTWTAVSDFDGYGTILSFYYANATYVVETASPFGGAASPTPNVWTSATGLGWTDAGTTTWPAMHLNAVKLTAPFTTIVADGFYNTELDTYPGDNDNYIRYFVFGIGTIWTENYYREWNAWSGQVALAGPVLADAGKAKTVYADGYYWVVYNNPDGYEIVANSTLLVDFTLFSPIYAVEGYNVTCFSVHGDVLYLFEVSIDFTSLRLRTVERA